MRQAHSSPFRGRAARCCLAALLASFGLPLVAQTTASPALVTNPAAPSAPLQHPPLPTSGSLVSQPADWRAANAAVAEFPRGHADVVQWEKAQASGKAPATPGTHPPAPAHHHGGRP